MTTTNRHQQSKLARQHALPGQFQLRESTNQNPVFDLEQSPAGVVANCQFIAFELGVGVAVTMHEPSSALPVMTIAPVPLVNAYDWTVGKLGIVQVAGRSPEA